MNRKEKIEHEKTHGMPRSPHWESFRKLHIEKACRACGSTKKLELHHIRPFHKHPELELVPSNVITLCEEGNCHLTFGHLRSYQSFNVNVVADAAAYLKKVEARP